MYFCNIFPNLNKVEVEVNSKHSATPPLVFLRNDERRNSILMMTLKYQDLGSREIKIHVYGIRQTSVENFSE